MCKQLIIMAGLVLAIRGGAATRMASEAYVTNRVHAVRSEMLASNDLAVAALAAEAAVRAEADGTNTAAIAAVADDVSVLQTARVDKVWSSTSTTNYMDGDGIMYEIVNGFTVTFFDVLSAESELPPDFDNPLFVSDTGIVIVTVSDDSLWTFTIDQAAPSLTKLVYNDSFYEDVWVDTGLYLDFPVTNITSMTGSGRIRVDRAAVTNIIDRTVTTNGTVIIIGSAADTSGSTTQLTARAGSETITMPFVGQDYVDTAVAAIPAIPAGGCTDLGTGTLITGATVAYHTEPTASYTLAVTNTAPRYTYSMRVESTNAYSLASGLLQDAAITPSGTNVFVFVPGTGTIWRVYGRAL